MAGQVAQVKRNGVGLGCRVLNLNLYALRRQLDMDKAYANVHMQMIAMDLPVSQLKGC